MKLIVKGKVYNKFECVCDSNSARALLDMLSQINKDNTYAPVTLEVESEIKDIIGKEYDICDNSYIIDINTKESAELVQREGKWYKPDKKERGSTFIICSYPYIERSGNMFNHYHVFVNVVSSKTKKTYRVLFFERQVIQ